MGGSRSVGTWAYIEAFRELMDQVRSHGRGDMEAFRLHGLGNFSAWSITQQYLDEQPPPVVLFVVCCCWQGLHENFDDVVVAVGSGGTLCGLAVANHLTGSKLKLAAKKNASYVVTNAWISSYVEWSRLIGQLEGSISCQVEPQRMPWLSGYL